MNPDFSTKTKGYLSSFDLKTKKKTHVSKSAIGNVDGLESDGNGNYYVSDWISGKVYFVPNSGDLKLILDWAKGTADIGYISATKTLIIPNMVESEIRAYTLQ